MRTIKNILFTSVIASVILVSINSYAGVIVSGTIEKKKSAETFTLKNLSFSNHKTATFATLKASLQFKGFASSDVKAMSSGSNTYMMYNKGNISYVIPYHHNVLTTKFKTPSAQ